MKFGGIFNPDGKIAGILNRLLDLMLLNLLFIAMCIPVVTIGANITALYYVTLRMVRKEDPHALRAYWKSFRENFKQATVIWLILLTAVIFLILDLFLCTRAQDGSIPPVCFLLFALLLLIALTALYVFPTQARFCNPIQRTLINAMFFSFRHLPSTIGMLALILVPPAIALGTSYVVLVYYVLYCVMFGFSLTAYAHSFLLHRIFQKYIPAIEKANSAR